MIGHMVSNRESAKKVRCSGVAGTPFVIIKVNTGTLSTVPRGATHDRITSWFRDSCVFASSRISPTLATRDGR